MARVLGYGGIANTNGARSFAGKAENENEGDITKSRARYARRRRSAVIIWLVLGGLLGSV